VFPPIRLEVALETQVRPDFRQKLERGLELLPPFSPVLAKLLASLASEDVTVATLADWIEKDAVLAGRVLRHVNSAAYGCSQSVGSVRHAVAIMGMTKLRNLVLSISVCRLWTQMKPPQGWSPVRFNLHSVATAALADLMAQHFPVEYGEGAFTAGLLHDIGKMLIALALPDEYLRINQLIRTSGRPPQACEAELIGMTHEELSAVVLTRWNLPVPIREAVAAHHGNHGLDNGSLAAVIEFADSAVNKMGISIVPPNPAVVMSSAAEVLTREELVKLADAFEREFEALKASF